MRCAMRAASMHVRRRTAPSRRRGLLRRFGKWEAVAEYSAVVVVVRSSSMAAEWHSNPSVQLPWFEWDLLGRLGKTEKRRGKGAMEGAPKSRNAGLAASSGQ